MAYSDSRPLGTSSPVNLPLEGRNSHQHDAYCVAAWMAKEDRSGRLSAFLNPDLSELERSLAAVEGWILGVL